MTTTTQTPVITTVSHMPDVEPAREERTARLLRAWAIAVLVPVALVGAVLSFDGLHSRARVVFSDPLAYGFPLLVDALILGCTLAYLAGAKVGRPRGGWRLAAHAGIAGTIALNAAAARSWAEVPWHITAPIVWSVLVELTGKELLGEWTAAHQAVRASIPARLWVTAPVESLRTWLRLARRLDGEQTAARLDVGVHAAAAHALALAVPGWRNRKVRRILRRQLRAGSLSPLAVLGPLGWTDDTTAALTHVDGPAVLRAALRDAIRAAARANPVIASPGSADPAYSVPVAAVVASISVTGAPAPRDAVDVDEADLEDIDDVADAHTRREREAEPDGPDTVDVRVPADEVAPRAGSRAATAESGEERESASTATAPAPTVPSPSLPLAPGQSPVPAGALALDLTGPAPVLTTTGDRGRDAVAVLNLHGRDITYHQLAEHLTLLGWVVPAGTSTRQGILTKARRDYDAARAGSRLAVVR